MSVVADWNKIDSFIFSCASRIKDILGNMKG